MSFLSRLRGEARPSFVDGSRELQRQLTASCGSRFAVAVTSCGRGAGVSTVCRALAATLAEPGTRRVILIDANSAHPSQHDALGVAPGGGLSQVLNGALEVGPATVPAAGRDFSVLPAGEGGARLAAGLGTERFRAVLGELRERFECIVLDCAPVHLSAETAAVARLTDGVVLVLEAGVTRWEVARAARAALDHGAVRVIGAVLNKRRYHVPASLYRRI